MKTTAEWYLTDPSTNQYGRQINKMSFEFKENGKDQKIIDLLDYSFSEKESFANLFGYTIEPMGKKGYSYLYTEYPENANWILAECIFDLS